MVCGAAVSAFSLCAFAAQDGKEWPTFREADADNSGAISIDEAQEMPGVSQGFSRYDKNGDGQLSRSEYESAKKGAAKAGGAGSATGAAGEKSRY